MISEGGDQKKNDIAKWEGIVGKSPLSYNFLLR